MKLRKTGFPQSWHLNKPISDVEVRGCEPNIFMSRAGSHEVGGEEGASTVDKGEGISQEKGAGGLGDGLSLRVITFDIGLRKETQVKFRTRS